MDEVVVNKDGSMVLQNPSETTAQAAEKMQASLALTLSNLASSSVESTLDKAGKVASSEEIQQFIKDQGLEPYLKDVTKDRVKNILSLFGLWYISKLFKNKYVLVGTGVLAVYILYTNKDKLLNKVATNVSA